MHGATLSREEPGASLDAALLAAAHRDAGAKPQHLGAREARAARRQWWPLAAAATVAAIAVGVLQLATPDQVGAPAEQAIVSDVPVAEKAGNTVMPGLVDKVAPPAAPAPPAANKLEGDGARARDEASRMDAVVQTGAGRKRAGTQSDRRPRPSRSRHRRRSPFPARRKLAAEAVAPSAAPPVAPSSPLAPPAPPAAPPAAAPPAPAAIARRGACVAERRWLRTAAEASASRMSERASASRRRRSPRWPPGHSRAADTGTSDARIKDRAPLPIPDWIALIRRLRDEGKTAEAAKELTAFRAAHARSRKTAAARSARLAAAGEITTAPRAHSTAPTLRRRMIRATRAASGSAQAARPRARRRA